MAELVSQQPPTANLEEITAAAALWIARRDGADWSVRDQLALDAWKAESLSHQIAFMRLDDIWERANRLQALKHLPRSSLSAIREWVWPARIVAGLALLAFIAVVGNRYVSLSDETAYGTLPGEHKVLTLSDGSTVELNTASLIRVRLTHQQRTIRLEKGEAFFNVRHDDSRPFVVLAGDHRITDIGTQFLVRAQPNQLEVALVEGRAQFDAPDGRMQSPILMTPGVTLVVAHNLITTMKRVPRELRNELAWRHGMLVFDQAPLSQIAAEFNRYGGKPIVIMDASVGKIPLSATLPTNGAKGFVELAQGMLGLKVVQSEHQIEISR